MGEGVVTGLTGRTAKEDVIHQEYHLEPVGAEDLGHLGHEGAGVLGVEHATELRPWGDEGLDSLTLYLEAGPDQRLISRVDAQLVEHSFKIKLGHVPVAVELRSSIMDGGALDGDGDGVWIEQDALVVAISAEGK